MCGLFANYRVILYVFCFGLLRACLFGLFVCVVYVLGCCVCELLCDDERGFMSRFVWLFYVSFFVCAFLLNMCVVRL